MADESHYDVLGVRPMADVEAIKRAYRDKVRQHHPDRFAGERARLQREGNDAAVREIDRKIAQAEKKTQQLNQAYAVLSDPVQRSNYDRSRGMFGRRSTPSSEASSGPYPNTNPFAGFQQPPPRTPKNDKVPWVWFGGLIIVVFISLMMVNAFLGGRSNAPTTDPAESASGPSARQLQSTESALQATRSARTQAIAQPTSTPLAPEDYVSSADAFMDLGFYELALDGYDEAFDAYRNDATIYLKRGQAYAGLAEGKPGDAADAALVNFRRALFLQPDLVDVYRERGLLYYALWRSSEDTAYAELARADLQQISEPDAAVTSALNQLNATS